MSRRDALAAENQEAADALAELIVIERLTGGPNVEFFQQEYRECSALAAAETDQPR